MRILPFKRLILYAIIPFGLIGMTSTAGAMTTTHSRITIRNVQQVLASQGYYRGPIDGLNGPRTRAAIRHFQNDNNLVVTGRLDSATLDRLGVPIRGEANRSMNMNEMENNGNSSTRGSSTAVLPSSTVRAAQAELRQKGFYVGQVDGVMSPQTRLAIREFQQSANLPTNGRLDRATCSRLGLSTDSNPGQ